MNENVPLLPPNKTVVNVFADFLRYLLECASSYIQETHPSGVDLWKAHRNEIHFVLSHPNGWEGKEQSQMRQAAVEAGLVPDTLPGHDRVSFVTEGEASLHFAIENGVLSQASEVRFQPKAKINSSMILIFTWEGRRYRYCGCRRWDDRREHLQTDAGFRQSGKSL